jgi:ribonuclease HII
MNEKQRKAKTRYERERRRLHRLHRFEYVAREGGHVLIGGVDEVGRGPLAGPVVAACVVTRSPLMLRGLNDSKLVQPQRRKVLAEKIKSSVEAWAIGSASVAEIDRLNIYRASILAMERAIGALACMPEYLITDAVRIPSFPGPQEPLIKGDARCAAVAAASIVAKVHRDALLEELDREDPRYGFASHKGYSTPEHIAALERYGPGVHHRANWRRIVELMKSASAKGRDGEQRAETFLVEQGYRIVDRNARLPGGEIDLVCIENETLVFVEVKRRDAGRFGSAISAVDARKRKRLRALAEDYAQIVAPASPIRFDVVALDGERTVLHRNAF